jgi:hypothetical protein
VTIRGYCECCRLDGRYLADPKAPDGLPASTRICGLCIKHLGSGPSAVSRRDRQHQEIYAEEARYAIELADEAHAAEAERLQKRIQELEEELATRPVRIVTENLDLEHVQDAERQRDQAFRSRDTAFRALAEVHMLHFSRDSKRCSCGIAYIHCKVAQIVDQYEALARWERRQAERRRQDLDHLLPPGHPGIIDATWEPGNSTAVKQHYS